MGGRFYRENPNEPMSGVVNTLAWPFSRGPRLSGDMLDDRTGPEQGNYLNILFRSIKQTLQ